MILATAALMLAAASPTPPPVPLGLAAEQAHAREWSVTRPTRGLHGRYLDSNVYAVWHDATHRERATWLCIRRHESMSYTGENPLSTASGAGQWLDGTWDGLKRWVKVDGHHVARQYDEAKDAPAWVQDAAFRHVYKRDRVTGRGMEMWNGTGCPGTGR